MSSHNKIQTAVELAIAYEHGRWESVWRTVETDYDLDAEEIGEIAADLLMQEMEDAKLPVNFIHVLHVDMKDDDLDL